MKKLFLPVIMACSIASYAQPTLTSTDLNPVPGDMFLGRPVDTTTSMPGASGASVTWDFHILNVTGLDTTTYVACTSTLYCDSFPGSNVASFGGIDTSSYTYFSAGASALSVVGDYSTGTFTHVAGHRDYIYYPLTYGSTHKDTSYTYGSYSGIPTIEQQVDSMIYDAYGTIKLPTGTLTNAVRVHVITVIKDSLGFPLDTSQSFQVETYYWGVAGFHNPVFVYTVDTSNGGSKSAEYYLPGIALKSGGPIANTAVTIYPNPANDVINIHFYASDVTTTSVTISDLLGRTVGAINSNELKPGANDISLPVSALPDGTYIVRVQNDLNSMVQKITVRH